eukprot:6473123-Amphidinium_carterae.1
MRNSPVDSKGPQYYGVPETSMSTKVRPKQFSKLPQTRHVMHDQEQLEAISVLWCGAAAMP